MFYRVLDTPLFSANLFFECFIAVLKHFYNPGIRKYVTAQGLRKKLHNDRLTDIPKIFRKTNISYPPNTHRYCPYQGVRNVSFSEKFFERNK